MVTHIIRNPNYVDDIHKSFASQGILRLLGAKLERIEPGYVEVSLPFRQELTQHTGFFHAGATTTIADTAAGYAAFTLIPPQMTVLSVEFKINLLNPAQGERLLARGRVLKSGRTLSVCEASVIVYKENQAIECAHMLQTMITLPS